MTATLPEPITYGPLTRTDLVRYAGASGDFNPLHHDHAFAADAGLRDIMAHGMLSAGLLASALTRWFGAGSVRQYSVRFKSPVWPGDVLTARCLSMEQARSETDSRVDLVIELARADGNAVLSGRATIVRGF